MGVGFPAPIFFCTQRRKGAKLLNHEEREEREGKRGRGRNFIKEVSDTFRLTDISPDPDSYLVFRVC